MTTHTIAWECFCTSCDWKPPGGSLGRNPKFRSGIKHLRETGHEVLVRQTIEWLMKSGSHDPE